MGNKTISFPLPFYALPDIYKTAMLSQTALTLLVHMNTVHFLNFDIKHFVVTFLYSKAVEFLNLYL